MEYVTGYLTLLWSAVEFLVYFWPVTLLLLVNLGIALIYARIKGRKTFSLNQILPLIWPLAAFVCGGLFRYDGPHGDAPSGPYILVNVLLGLQVVNVLVLVWWNRGYRWVTASVGSILLWYGLFCNAIATMMVTNLWL